MRPSTQFRTVGRTVAAAGAASLLAQVVLLREILASAHGNELVLGVVLAGWLTLTGVASALGGRVGHRLDLARAGLGLLLHGAPILLLTSLWLVRLTGPATFGQDVPVARLVSASYLALVPACLLGGLSFAWATHALGDKLHATKIYVVETLGMAAAGVCFHLVLAERVGSAWILWGAGTLCALASLLPGLLQGRWKWASAAAVIVGTAFATPHVSASLLAARFPGEQVLSVRPSRYGLLAVLARGEQRIFVHDGVLLFTTEDEAMAEETVHLPLLLHPNPRRILMVGGGLGGGLVQALAHAPARIDYAEMDPEVLSLARVFASDRTRAALDDPRVHALSEDARRVLRAASARYDVILIDLPVAQNALQARLATQACFADARRALAPGGLLALVTPGSDAYLDRAARLRHASVLATLRAVFPSVGAIPGAHSFFWASESEVVARPALLVARMRERGLVLSRIGPTWIADKLLPFHLQDYARSLAGVQGMVNHDFRPVVYLLGLAEELERMSPALAHAALATLRPHAHEALIALGTLVVLAFVLLARRGRARPGLAVWTAGAAALALQMVVLLAYQAILGHLYHALGVMTAAGMIGMALGAWASSRWLRGRKVLAWACLLAAATCALAPPGLSLARVLPSWASMLVALLAFVVGVGTGSVYPAAVQVSAQADAPARLYAWDLVGAAGAAAGTSLLAVPLLGFFPVAWLAAAACAAAGLASLRGD